MSEIHIKASADVGNSSTKIIVIDGVVKKARKQASVINYLPAVPQFEDDDLNTLVANLHKNIVVHITSPSIAQSGLFSVGELANTQGGIGFNIEQHKKAEHDITIIQPLSMVAVTAIQNAYQQTNELPKAMTVELEYTTAIPLVDYTIANAKALESRLLGSHILVVYVGEGHTVQVTLNVVGAKVVQEGIPAFYALVNGSPEMFDKYNERYKVNFTGKNFIKRKLLFVDIGDGTTEFITIIDGKPISIKSKGERVGVGYASEKALVAFEKNYKLDIGLNRSKFMEKVLNKRDKWHNEASKELDLAKLEQGNRLFTSIVNIIEKTLSSDLDDIIVFGGGTNVFTDLEQRLVDYGNMYKMRTLWIDGQDSSLLTAIGLNELSNKVFFKK